MLPYGSVTRTAIATIDVDEQRLRVTLHVSHDGVEYVGRLWFANTAWEDAGIPDRGIFPGRTEGEVLALARRLRPDELLQRFRRANAEKRKFHGLRQLTLELLSKVRYLNQVAVSMRAGLLDVEAAQQEIELTERQMVELVKQARVLAGVES
ncbi:MAG: hypothetical protein H7Z40_08565 [Phycisphaerae bacterium]|nr:hypothetical protein [Gemmatimonadaceae bacterium]